MMLAKMASKEKVVVILTKISNSTVKKCPDLFELN